MMQVVAAGDDAHAAAAAAPALLPALPHEVLVRVFRSLPRGALAVTPGRVCHAWAAAKAEACAALAPLSPYERRRPFLPAWLARSNFEHGLLDRRVLQPFMNAAALHGQVEVLAYFAQVIDSAQCYFVEAIQYAAEGGQVATLQLLSEHRCSNELAGQIAAARGHLPALQWCWAHKYRRLWCPWPTKRLCASAAKGGHLDAVIFLRDNGCDWDESTTRAAASGGHVDVLAHAVERGCPINVDECVRAAHASAECLGWLRSRFGAAPR